MPAPTVNFWWTLLIGTAAFLSLGIGLVTVLLVHERTKRKLESEKTTILRESERRYGDLFNNVTDLIYIHAIDGTILTVNESIAKLLCLDGQTLTGKSIQDFLHPRFRKQVETYLSRISTGTGHFEGRLPIYLNGGSKIIVIEFRSSPVVESGKIVAVRGIGREITERLSYERSMRQSNIKLEKALSASRTMERSLSELSKQMIQFQEDDHKRISRELHDEIGQILTTITFNMEILKRDLEGKASDGILRRVDESQSLAQDVIESVHQVIGELRPVSIDELGILPTLRKYIHEFTERTRIPVFFTEEAVIEHLSANQKISVYRIVQEALTNIIKHAHASAVRITIGRCHAGGLAIQISDDGYGFDPQKITVVSPDAANNSLRLGLLGMRERVKLIGGEIAIDSTPGAGTEINLTIFNRREE